METKKILVTGGCGFIGSNFIAYLLRDLGREDVEIVNLDKQTYAGKGKNLEHMGLSSDPRYKLIKGDICDKEVVDRIFEEERPVFVFNFAAESHVDKSIENNFPFVNSNVLGTVNLLEAAQKFGVKKFVQIGTDEVYGSLSNTDKSSSEQDKLNPRNSYSASKAGADLLALSYYHTHGLPVIVTRSVNNYGPYQFSKLLPLFITNLIDGKKVPLMWSEENPGLNVRDWLHVRDNCRAIWFVSQKGENGRIYNIPGENEKTNIDITHMLLSIFGLGEEMIEKITHRKAHDFRYSISGEKLKKLGFEYKYKDFANQLKEVCRWYRNNENWWRPLKNSKEVGRGVVFGKGFLGTRIAEELGYKLVGREINPLHLRILADFLDSEKPDIVINAIGKTGRPNIDWCEDHKAETMESNVTVAINLATECSKRGIYLVYLGSGCIYEGDNKGRGFSEEDEPNFFGSFHSKTKIIAEKALKEFPCLILRIKLPIDNQPHLRNLIDKLKSYKIVIDVQNSTTTIPHMINAMKRLIEKRKTGIYNLVNTGTISAAEIMRMYKEIVDSNHNFEVCSLEDLEKVTKARRSNCILNTERLQKEGINMLEICEAVKSCLLEYKSKSEIGK